MSKIKEGRLFIGNLASEKTSEKELREIFEKHGRVIEIIIRKSFGFVQFENSESAKRALEHENGRNIGNCRIGLFYFFVLFFVLKSNNPKTKQNKQQNRFESCG